MLNTLADSSTLRIVSELKGLLTLLVFVCVDLPRPRKRLTELMLKAVKVDEGHKANKQWGFRFLRSPLEVLSDAQGKTVTGIRLVVNKLEVKLSV